MSFSGQTNVRQSTGIVYYHMINSSDCMCVPVGVLACVHVLVGLYVWLVGVSYIRGCRSCTRADGMCVKNLTP